MAYGKDTARLEEPFWLKPFWLKGFGSRVFALGRLGFLRVALESFSLGCNGGGVGACNVLI